MTVHVKKCEFLTSCGETLCAASNSRMMNGFIVLKYSLICWAVNNLHFVALIHWLCILSLCDKSADLQPKEDSSSSFPTRCVFKTNILRNGWQQMNGTSGYLALILASGQISDGGHSLFTFLNCWQQCQQRAASLNYHADHAAQNIQTYCRLEIKAVKCYSSGLFVKCLHYQYAQYIMINNYYNQHVLAEENCCIIK